MELVMQKRYNETEAVVPPQMSAFHDNVYIKELNISQHPAVRHQHCVCLCETNWNGI